MAKVSKKSQKKLSTMSKEEFREFKRLIESMKRRLEPSAFSGKKTSKSD